MIVIPGKQKLIEFQSHFGSIKTVDADVEFSLDGEGFNPTLVRLKLVRLFALESKGTMFQSHFGSIKTAVS